MESTSERCRLPYSVARARDAISVEIHLPQTFKKVTQNRKILLLQLSHKRHFKNSPTKSELECVWIWRCLEFFLSIFFACSKISSSYLWPLVKKSKLRTKMRSKMSSERKLSPRKYSSRMGLPRADKIRDISPAEGGRATNQALPSRLTMTACQSLSANASKIAFRFGRGLTCSPQRCWWRLMEDIMSL